MQGTHLNANGGQGRPHSAGEAESQVFCSVPYSSPLTHSKQRSTLFHVSDKRRVTQDLINLVRNAVKFTESGSVTVRAEKMATGFLEVSVVDTGIGIRESDLNKLFQPFQQIDEMLTKKYGGRGWGFILCEKYF